MPHAFAGNILFVNLSDGSSRCEKTLDYADWIGGRSLAAHLLAEHPLLLETDPARQPVVIAAGPLVASGLPMGTRTAVAARSLVSGGYSYSNVGGDFGPRLKMAGFDALVLAGASPQPSILLVQDGQAQIRPAGELWGRTISDTRAALVEQYGETGLSFLGIGPAGERGARIACLVVDGAHAAGWGGSGAIFGAKNLKAVVAIGQQPVEVFDLPGLQRKAQALRERIRASEAMQTLARGGTHAMAAAGGFSGLVPTAVNNLQDEYWTPEQSASIREEAYRAWEMGRTGCSGCFIRCLHAYDLPSTRFGPLAGEGMHANSVRGFGSNLGLRDAEALFAAHLLCNEHGLDVDGAAAAAAFALECVERGIDLPGLPEGAGWGNGPAIVELVRQMAAGEGLGLLLGEGVAEAARQIGQGSEALAMTVKGVGINEQGLRSHRAWALGVMTATRGGGHLGGSPQTENRRIPAEQSQALFGHPTAGVPQAYESKGRLAAWTEGLKCAVDSLGLCYFVYGWYDLSLGSPDELAEMLALASGQHLSGEELHRIGLRTHALERKLSYRLAGFSRKDDRLPDRIYDTPVSSGPYAGAHLDRQAVEAMLDEYYAALGWDAATGLPPEALEGGSGF